MKKTVKKIKWVNVIKLIALVGCTCLVLHDVYMLTIYTWITGKLTSWTWLGLITFVMAFTIAEFIYEDLKEEAGANE